MSRLSPRLRIAASALVLATALSGCAKTIEYRGYVPEQDALAEIKPGVDTRQTVSERLGTPSSVTTFGDDAWYYISSTTAQVAFFNPEEIDRKVVAITFDEAGMVREVERYGLKDGQEVAFVERETPTRGRSLTVLQQVFGNIGRIGSMGGGGEGGSGPNGPNGP